MATYLSLFQDAVLLSGVSNETQTTVAGQTGEYAILLKYIAKAYNEIQTSRDNWRFLWNRTEFDTTIDDSDYDTGTTGLTDFDRIKEEGITIYEKAVGVSDENEIFFLPYKDWRSSYEVGEQDSERPTVLTLLPDNTIRLNPPPDKVYTVELEYYTSNDTMTADADVPVLPSKFHDLILYLALEKHSKFNESSYGQASNMADYEKLFNQMLFEELVEEYSEVIVE